MPDLPTGTVAFLFTDIEGSSTLWDTQPESTARALARHDEIAQEIVGRHHGQIVKLRSGGDSLFVVFERVSDAVYAAISLQRAYVAESWPTATPLRVRIGVHVGESDLRNGDYYGTQVNRAARVRDAAHGSQILVSQAVAELTRQTLPPGASLRHLGSYQLKGMLLPEGLYQVCHPELPDCFPAINAMALSEWKLPPQFTRFVGRERELGRVRELLKSERLVVLTGPGGIGKTRLAIEAATLEKEQFPQGLWFVDLAPVTDSDQVAPALLLALGLRGEASRTALEIARDYLRTRSALLVLDNSEHLLEGCAALVEGLLGGCPSLKMIATSREPLHAAGEVVYVVPMLSTEDGAQSDSVRLFVERARAADAAWRPADGDLPLIREMCQRLEGIPLAIEIAASAVRTLSIREMSRHLERQMRQVGGRLGGRQARHRTLDAAIRWSFDLLSAEEKLLFQRLSVFVGGWTLDACEAVCSGGPLTGDDVFFLLSNLTDKSLVIAEPGAVTRYRLLDMVRGFAAARLAETNRGRETEERHADWAAGLAENLSSRLKGGGQIEALDRLEAEHDNIRGVLRACQDGRLSEGYAVRIAAAIWWFWYVRGHLAEGRRWLEYATTLPECARQGLNHIEALSGLGTLYWVFGQTEEAELCFNTALAACSQPENLSARAYLLASLGVVISLEPGRLAVARAQYEEAIAAALAAGDDWNRAGALNNLGALYGIHNDFKTARQYYTESLDLSRKINDPRGVAFAVANLAEAAEKLGDVEGALAFYEEGDNLARLLGERRLLSWTVLQRAQLLLASGNINLARTLFQEARTLGESLGDPVAVNEATRQLAAVGTNLGAVASPASH